MQASVLLSLKVSEKETYDINLDLPTSKPTSDKPFVFEVNKKATGSGATEKDTVLKVVIGEEKQAYIAVAPPQSLLETAGVGEYVNDLKVVVQEGEYDSETTRFKTQNSQN